VLSMRAVGAKYAVSDNAVRKWIRSYERGESDAPMSARLGGGRK
jgi:transposase